jgi:proteic killer suppression protein
MLALDTLWVKGYNSRLMNVKHTDGLLERLELEDVPKSGLSVDLMKLYRRRMQLIRAARDERDFYALKSLHYEKLAGNLSHQRSMRLNKQWRLILTIEETGDERLVVILKIEDYH